MSARSIVVAVGLAFGTLAVACGGTTSKSKTPPKALDAKGFKNATRCETTGPDREVSYHDLEGAGRPNMIEVIGYKKSSTGVSEGRPLCMELDTNRDGVLDLLRVFDDKGAIESEEADRNYDGKSDVWITYKGGLIEKIAFDTQYKGVADEFHYYKDGKLKRVERDRNDDGKIDVWEFYLADGSLERMGVDLDFNGKVDAWYRDEAAHSAGTATKTAAASTTSSAASTSSSAAPASSSSSPPKPKT